MKYRIPHLAAAAFLLACAPNPYRADEDDTSRGAEGSSVSNSEASTLTAESTDYSGASTTTPTSTISVSDAETSSAADVAGADLALNDRPDARRRR